MRVCITIDMDNYQDYARLVGSGGGDPERSFYDDAVPRFLDLLDAAGARATFFMVGRDGARAGNRTALRRIAEAHRGARTIVVSHGGAINLGLGLVLDGQPNSWSRVVDNCSVTELTLEPEPRLLSFNETGHLGDVAEGGGSWVGKLREELVSR